VNCAVRVWVGSNVAQQPKGSCVIGSPFASVHTGVVPKARVVKVLRRASAKYTWLNELVLVTVMGTMIGPALTETLWLGLFGRPLACTCAVSMPICAVNGSEVWLPEVK
jgi:hypothetical protein